LVGIVTVSQARLASGDGPPTFFTRRNVLKDHKIYVFGYGSLMNPGSIQKTVSREVPRETLITAVLHDYVRKWDLVELIRFVDDRSDSVVPAVFLDVVKQSGREVNGILLALSEEELRKMDEREKNYNRVNVSSLAEPIVSPDVFSYVGDVFTYVGKDAHTHPPPDACVPSYYEEALVLAGVREWGAAFETQYHQTTLPHNFPRRSGRYVFAEPRQSRR